jgi:hypothetical protein
MIESGPTIGSCPNPFSTRHVRPGAIDFLFEDGDSAELVVQRFLANFPAAQIVGPHGSGKSTLLRHILRRCEKIGWRTMLITTTRSGRKLSLRRLDYQLHCGPQTVVAVDGFEQFPFWRRLALCRRARRDGFRLLVTTHRPMRLPCLYTTKVTQPLAHRIVASILARAGASRGPAREAPPKIDDRQLARLLDLHRGNMREVLFSLYDLYRFDPHPSSPSEARGHGPTDPTSTGPLAPLRFARATAQC